MKGFKFFLEYPSAKEKRRGTVKEPGRHAGNCLAAVLDRRTRGHNMLDWFYIDGEGHVQCLAALFDKPNSPVMWTAVSYKHLDKRCKRIPERLAREIHPELFARLEGA